MANGFSKAEMVFWEQILVGFDANNITARNVSMYRPSAQAVERSGLTVRRPYPYIGREVTGLDVSASYQDMSEITCPVSLSDSDIRNHPFRLTAHDRNDPVRLRRIADASVQILSTMVDKDVQDTIATRGSVVVAETAQFDTYTKLSKGDTALMERETPQSTTRNLVLNPRAANAMAGDLAARQFLDGRPLSAYERASLPPIAGMNTFRANVIQQIASSASAGVTVNGANQGVTPVPFNSTGTLGAGEVDDPRSQVLVVSAASGLKLGDAITIAGVNSVGAISKKDTGQLQTFRVLALAGNNATITPAIIPANGANESQKQYATVTVEPANGAAITIINTATSQPSIFFARESVEIFSSELDTDDLGSNVSVMSEVTDSGIPILFARQGEIDDLSARYRLTVWTKAHVLQPQQAGVMLPGQGAAVG